MSRRSFAVMGFCLSVALVTAAGATKPSSAAVSPFSKKVVCVGHYSTAAPTVQFTSAFRGYLGAHALGAKVRVGSAEGDIATAQTIAQQFVHLPCNVIVDFSGVLAQITKHLTSTIPIVAVSNTLLGTGVLKSLKHPGGNATGVLFPAPIAKNIAAMLAIDRSIKKIGIIYHNGDIQGDQQNATAKKYIQKLGLTAVSATIAVPSDTTAAAQSLVSDGVDAIDLPCDTMTLAGQDGALKVAREAKIPLFGCLSTTVASGGIVSANSYSWADAGSNAAKVVIRILKGADPGRLPVVVMKSTGYYLNKTMATQLGLTIPQSLLNFAVAIY